MIARSGWRWICIKPLTHLWGGFLEGLPCRPSSPVAGFLLFRAHHLPRRRLCPKWLCRRCANMAIRIVYPPLRWRRGERLASSSPPSIILVIYGFLTGQSIGKLFLAGILPGLFGCFLYLVAVAFVVWRDPAAGPPGSAMQRDERNQAMLRVIPIVILFFFIFGGIYLSVFTVDEAAGMGAFGAVFIAICTGRFSWKGLVEALSQTVQTSIGLFILLIGAEIFNRFITPCRLARCVIVAD